MFWIACLPFTRCLPGIQCVALLLMPFIASISGPAAVLRFSLMLMAHGFIFAFAPSFVKRIPLLESSIFVLLVAFPMNYLPPALIWVFDKIVWTSEPLLMVIEALSVVQVVTSISRQLVEYMEENEFLVKTIILGASVISYSCAVFLWFLTYFYAENHLYWLIIFILAVSIVMLILTVYADSGIISDCAVLSLYLMWCVWFMQQENKLAASPLKAPQQWQSSSDTSLVEAVMEITSLDNFSRSIKFLWKLFSPTSILLILIRTLTVSYALILTRSLAESLEDKDEGFFDSEDEDDDEDSTSTMSCFRNQKAKPIPIPFQVAFILVFTQIIVYNTDVLVSPDDMTSFFSIEQFNLNRFMYIGDLRTFRMVQMGVCVISYCWFLWKEAESDPSW